MREQYLKERKACVHRMLRNVGPSWVVISDDPA